MTDSQVHTKCHNTRSSSDCPRYSCCTARGDGGGARIPGRGTATPSSGIMQELHPVMTPGIKKRNPPANADFADPLFTGYPVGPLGFWRGRGTSVASALYTFRNPWMAASVRFLVSGHEFCRVGSDRSPKRKAKSQRNPPTDQISIHGLHRIPWTMHCPSASHTCEFSRYRLIVLRPR